jgi:hypothetical protein
LLRCLLTASGFDITDVSPVAIRVGCAISFSFDIDTIPTLDIANLHANTIFVTGAYTSASMTSAFSNTCVTYFTIVAVFVAATGLHGIRRYAIPSGQAYFVELTSEVHITHLLANAFQELRVALLRYITVNIECAGLGWVDTDTKNSITRLTVTYTIQI